MPGLRHSGGSCTGDPRRRHQGRPTHRRGYLGACELRARAARRDHDRALRRARRADIRAGMIDLLTAQWQRFLVYGVIALLACALLELDGYRRGEKKLWDYQAKQATEAVHIVVKRGAV